MSKRTSAKATEPAQPPLRKLGDEEMQKAYNKARRAGKLHEPKDLRTAWANKKKMVRADGVNDLVRMLREGAASSRMDDPETTSAYLAMLVEAIVERFETLVQSGAMDQVLPRITALPVLYSTKAGKGAPEWQWARDLFEEKQVGTDAVSGHRGSDYEAARDANWGFLAVAVVKLAFFAAADLPKFDSLKAQAVATGYKVARRPGAHYAWRGRLYLLSDDGLLIWPEWLELCRGLPRTIKDDVPRYQKACRAMVQEFFGDPGNKLADDLITAKISSTDGKTRARVRLEAVESVVAAVGRLGGWKR